MLAVTPDPWSDSSGGDVMLMKCLIFWYWGSDQFLSGDLWPAFCLASPPTVYSLKVNLQFNIGQELDNDGMVASWTFLKQNWFYLIVIPPHPPSGVRRFLPDYHNHHRVRILGMDDGWRVTNVWHSGWMRDSHWENLCRQTVQWEAGVTVMGWLW